MRPILAILAAWFCATVPAFAQDAARMPVIGLMRVNAAANNEPFATLFREGLAVRGYFEGRNLRLN